LEFNELFVRDKSDIDDDLFSSLLDRIESDMTKPRLALLIIAMLCGIGEGIKKKRKKMLVFCNRNRTEQTILSLVRLFREKIVKKISSILPIWKQARGIYDLVL
jgi:hypothetical protein